MCRDETQEGCRKPENLKGKPRDCSPEQVRECHGDTNAHACAEPAGCEHPDRLAGRPGECSPGQVRRCHGDAPGDPCG